MRLTLPDLCLLGYVARVAARRQVTKQAWQLTAGSAPLSASRPDGQGAINALRDLHGVAPAGPRLTHVSALAEFRFAIELVGGRLRGIVAAPVSRRPP